jgi:hypothetical protein
MPGDNPDDYEYIERDSWTYISPVAPNLRIGDGYFVGETRRDAVAKRYRRILQKKGYNLIKDVNRKSVELTELTFYHVLRDEIVQIDIERGSKNRIFVHIQVEPKLESK